MKAQLFKRENVCKYGISENLDFLIYNFENVNI